MSFLRPGTARSLVALVVMTALRLPAPLAADVPASLALKSRVARDRSMLAYATQPGAANPSSNLDGQGIRDGRAVVADRSASLTVDGWTTVQRGVFRYRYSTPPSVEDWDLLALIDVEFQVSLGELSTRLGHVPTQVNVIVDGGNQQYPGLYTPEVDTITVAAKWFRYDRPSTDGRLSAAQLRRLTSHVVRHELSHLLVAHRLGLTQYTRNASTLPLWLLEGFAEWAAGTAQNACRTPEEVKSFFHNGVLDYAQMEEAMQVTARPKDAFLNHKAYVQSFFIAKFLIGQSRNTREGLDRYLDLIGHLMSTRGQFDVVLRSRYGLSMDSFSRGWQDLLRRDVVDLEQPHLDAD